MFIKLIDYLNDELFESWKFTLKFEYVVDKPTTLWLLYFCTYV